MVSPENRLQFLRPATRPRRDRGVLAVGTAILVAVWLSLVHASWLHYDAARTRGHAIATELARDIEVGIERLASHIAALMDAAAAQLADGPPSSDLVTMLQQRAGSGSPVFQRVEIHTLDGRPIARIPAEPIGFPSAPGSSKPVLADHTMRVVQAWGDGNDRAIALARLLVDAAGTPIATMRVEIAADTLVRHDPRPTTDPATTIAVLLSDGTRIAAAPGAASDARGDTTIALSGPDRPALEPGRDVDGDPWILARRNAALGDSGIEIVIGLRGDSFYAAADRRILVFGAIAAILSVLLFTVGRRLQRDRDIHAIGSRDLAIAAGSIEAIDACIAVVERSPEGNDRVVAVNSGFPALLGRPSDDLLGSPWKDVVGATGAAWLDQLGKPIETRFAKPDGETSWLEIRLAPIAAATSHGPLVLVSMRDITQRKQTELAMLRAKNQAEIANRAKSDFLANMSHELRTPLNAILGFSEIISKQLLGPVGTAAYKEYANDIWVSGSHLLNIITDILDFAKIEAATLKLEESEIDLARLLGTCVRFMAGRSTQARVEVVVDVPAAFPRLIADDLRLKQIVLNLLGNAVKFSPPGSTVSINASVNADGGVDLSIVDRGCGMSPSDVEAALQPFRQIESTMVKRAEGTGLGLPLAKRLIELHGGRLLIETAPQVGTTVTVRLPVTRARLVQAAA